MTVESLMLASDRAARRRFSVTLALVLVVVLFALVSLGIGPVQLSPLTVVDALFGGGSDAQQVIVREIRLPRAILGLSIGAMLGLSGAALQGLLRNPLASPSLFGAPQAAAFGAVATISLGLADTLSFALPVAAIFGAFASVFLLLAVAPGGARPFEHGRSRHGARLESRAQSLRGARNRILAPRLVGGPQPAPCRPGAAFYFSRRRTALHATPRLPGADVGRRGGAEPWGGCSPPAPP